MRHFARATDGNHAEIRDGLRKMGVWCADTSRLGDGFPDLIACHPLDKRLVLLEVKDPKQLPNKRKLKPSEERFHRQCPGPCFVVETLDEALDVVMPYTVHTCGPYCSRCGRGP